MRRFLLTLILILASCTKSHHDTRNQGGQDGGGGDVPVSTSEQVVESLMRVHQQITTANLVNYSLFIQRPQENDIEDMLLKISYPTSDKVKAKKIETDIDQGIIDPIYGLAEKLLGASRILVKDAEPRSYTLNPPYLSSPDGPCVGVEGPVDASVSKNDWEADICVSVTRLRRFAPESLDKEIFALMIHELVHINGHGEADAQRVQKFVADHYDQMIYSTGLEYRLHLDLIFLDVDSALMNAYDQYTPDQTGATLYTLGLANGDLYGISQAMPDQSPLNGILTPRHPENSEKVAKDLRMLKTAVSNLAAEINGNSHRSADEIRPLVEAVRVQLHTFVPEFEDWLGVESPLSKDWFKLPN